MQFSEQRRLYGTISQWNLERGFGFLQAENGERVFVHVSRLPMQFRSRDSQAALIGVLFSFEICKLTDGRKFADAVLEETA